MVFLLQNEYGLDLGFKFIRYNYGPYSFDLTDTLNSMKTLNLIDENILIFGDPTSVTCPKQLIYKLTEKGRVLLKSLTVTISSSDTKKIKAVLADWNNKSREEIVKYVYSKYMNNDSDLPVSVQTNW